MTMAIKSEWSPIWSVIMQPWIGGAIFWLMVLDFWQKWMKKFLQNFPFISMVHMEQMEDETLKLVGIYFQF